MTDEKEAESAADRVAGEMDRLFSDDQLWRSIGCPRWADTVRALGAAISKLTGSVETLRELRKFDAEKIAGLQEELRAERMKEDL